MLFLLIAILLGTMAIFIGHLTRQIEKQTRELHAALKILLYCAGYDDEKAGREEPHAGTETVLSWYPLSRDAYEQGKDDAMHGAPHKHHGPDGEIPDIDEAGDEADIEETVLKEKENAMYKELVDRLRAVGIVERDDSHAWNYEEKVPVHARIHKAIEIAREVSEKFEERIEYSFCYQYGDPLIVDVTFEFLDKTYTFGTEIPL